MFGTPDALMHGLIDVYQPGHPRVTSVVVTSYAAPVIVVGRLEGGLAYEFRVGDDASLRAGTSPLGLEFVPTHNMAISCPPGLDAREHPEQLVELFALLIAAVEH